MPRPRKDPLPKLDSSFLIGNRLAQLRKAKGLTQIQLGKIIGISQYQISDYEIGRLHLSDEMIIRFAKALKVTSDSILGLDKTKIETPSLKLIKRIDKIEMLPLAQQKTLLKTIDMFLKGAETEDKQ